MRESYLTITGNPNTLSTKKINVLLFTCVFFESFRRDLNEAKAVSCNFVNYLISSVNISHLPLCNYDAPITSQVSRTSIITKRQMRNVYRRDS